MNKGYTEWITKDRIGFITNAFGRILYVNREWPDGSYEKWTSSKHTMLEILRKNATVGRTFTKEDLMLELL